MIIRVEQGKGGKDRHVMLSSSLLDLLRAWRKAARPQGSRSVEPTRPRITMSMRLRGSDHLHELPDLPPRTLPVGVQIRLDADSREERADQLT